MTGIYFDNSATTPLLPQLLSFYRKAIEEFWGNPSSIHTEGRKARLALEQARFNIAGMLNCSPEEIFFTSTATEALNTIITGIDTSKKFSAIISTPVEHSAILNPLARLKNLPCFYVRVKSNGDIDTDHLYDVCKKNRGSIFIAALGNNEIGNTLPLSTILKIMEETDCFLALDCVQCWGKMKFSISHQRILYATGSSHKFHGPKGAAFFVMKKEGIIPPLITGGHQEKNMRAGTENTPAILVMEKALSLALSLTDEFIKHTQNLKNHLITLLSSHLNIRINGGGSHPLPHIINISFLDIKNYKSDALVMRFDTEGVFVSAGSACTSGANQHSHVLAALGIPDIPPYIRVSFSLLNTVEEVEKFVEIATRIVHEKRTAELINPFHTT